MVKPFKQLVGESIGEASVCWDVLPSGIFNSTRAVEIVGEVCAPYDALRAELNLTQHAASAEADEADRLRAENARLRAALEKINQKSGIPPIDVYHWSAYIAQAALAADQAGGSHMGFFDDEGVVK